MVGGEGQGRNGYFEGIPIVPPTERFSLYSHIGTTFGDWLNAGLDVSYGHLVGHHKGAQYRNTSFVIQRDNPFIPTSSDPALNVRGILDANPAIASFQLGRHFDDIGNPDIVSRDKVIRAVASFDGKIGDNWGWDAYYQFGRNTFRTASIALFTRDTTMVLSTSVRKVLRPNW